MNAKGRWLAVILIACPALIAAKEAQKSSFVIYKPGAASASHAIGTMVAPRRMVADAPVPRKNAVLAILRRVNAYQTAHPVVETAPSGQPILDPLRHPWPRATWYIGVMAAWKATKDPAFLKQAMAYGRKLEWQMGKQRVGPNHLWLIQLWAELYFVTRDRRMIQPSIDWLSKPSPITPAGSREWYLDGRGGGRPIPYADSIFGAPALAMLAKATGNRKYLEIMNAFFDGVTKALFDPQSGLYYRDPSYIPKRTASGKKILWSRGNGWVFAGIPRVLDYLPENYPGRQRYLRIFRRMAEELIKRQGADGLWRMNLDDPDQFPNPETSGSSFFCFGLAWGINHGVLPRQVYLPAVKKAWEGLTRSISPEGEVLGGQPVQSEPSRINRNNTSEFDTGAFLLAGSAIYNMALN